MSSDKQNNLNVEHFFESYAESFDSIYQHNNRRSSIDRYIDRIFRVDMYNRFQQTIKNINEHKINSVLDVGCGSGRYCVEYLRYGKNIIGIDLAEGMLNIAQRICKENFPDGNYQFIHADYFNYEFNRKFDASVLMGLFDYIEDPKSLLNKLRQDTDKYILASFPKLWNILTLQRKIRYQFRQCPIYFYTKKQIKNILKDLKMDNYKIIDGEREFYVKIILKE